jgi:hypothetical protein
MMQTIRAMVAALMLSLAGCGGDSAGPGDGGTNGGGTTPSRLELALTRAGASLSSGSQVTVGDTVHIIATAYSASGSAIPGVALEWSPGTGTLITSEPATGATGARATWIVGTTPGNQTISVSARNTAVQTSASLSAVIGPAFRLSLQPGYAIFVTGRRQIPVVAADRFGNPVGSGSANSWLALDPSIATISAGGELNGVAPGNARIVAVQGSRSDTIVVPVLDPARIKQGQIAAGTSYSCRLDRDGRAYCWGYGRWGQLGGGAITCAIASQVGCARSIPEPVQTELRFSYIDAAGDKTFAIETGERMMMWGRWDGFSTRDGSVDCSGMIDQWCFVRPMNYSAGPFAEVDFTGSSLCARTPSGQIHCWYGSFGATGSGIQHEGDYVVGNHTFTQQTSSGTTVCALDISGAAFCWGVARDASSDAPTDMCFATPSNVPCYLRPVPVATSLRFTHIAAGAGGHTCALATDLRAYCWGRNDAGQLGAGTTGEPSRIVQVASSMEFAVIGAGSYNTCGTTYGGDSYCWGDNRDGQLGIGTVGGTRTTPTRVASNVTFVDYVGNFDHTCGLAPDGKTYCWGGNEYGQIGAGTVRGHIPTPTLVVGQ